VTLLAAATMWPIYLTENRPIYIPHLYSIPTYKGTHRNFAKMFSIGKTKMIGLFSADTLPWETVET